MKLEGGFGLVVGGKGSWAGECEYGDWMVSLL